MKKRIKRTPQAHESTGTRDAVESAIHTSKMCRDMTWQAQARSTKERITQWEGSTTHCGGPPRERTDLENDD
jgi:hypothetical protein